MNKHMKYLRIGKWTPVSKRYPDDEKLGNGFFVTVRHCGETYTTVSSYIGDKKFKIDDDYTDAGKFNVIAWMPLAKPYKGEF